MRELKKLYRVNGEDWNLDPGRSYLAIRAEDNAMLGRGIGKGYLVIFTDAAVEDGDVAVVSLKGKLCARIVRYCGDCVVLYSTAQQEPEVEDKACVLGKVVLVAGKPA
jgi:SOS-response transcriptional repressor LexA